MNELRNNFDAAVKAYLNELHKMFGWDTLHGYWVADDNTGVYAYEDAYTLSLSEIIFIVDNQLSLEEVDEWHDYTLRASVFYFRIPTLQEWHKGCKRVSEDEFLHLESLKKRLEDEVEKLEELY